MRLKTLTLLAFSTITLYRVSAQPLSGTYTIDGTFSTFGTNFNNFTDAILALNTNGVDTSNGVVFEVTAGQTFSERPPVLYASGGVINRIIFRKSGVGANPVIIPNVPGSLTVSALGNFGDGIFRLAGADNITIDAIDIDTNSSHTTAAQIYDYGYMLMRRNATDGCQNITIQNCTITIRPAIIHTSAIFSASFDSTGTAVTVTAESGRMQNVIIRNNSIRNAYHGIQLRGFNHTTSPYNFFDHFCTIDSNTVSGFGGASTEANGIYTIYHDTININNNTVTSATTAAALYGVRTESALNATTYILRNSVSITSTSGTIYPLFNNAGGTGAGNFVDISHNRVFGCSTAGSGALYGIRGQASASTMHISNNEIFNCVNNGTGATYMIWSIPGGATNSFVFSNKIYNITVTSTSNSSTLYPYICNTSTGQTHVFKNLIHDITHNGSGTGNLIINRSNAANFFCYNNIITRLFTPNSTGVDAIRAIELNTGANQKVLFNTVYLNASSASLTNYGNTALHIATGVTAEVRNNIFVNASIPGPSGGIVTSYRRSTATLTSYDNLSNNNCFYVDTTLTRRAIYTDGTNTDNSMFAFRARVGPTRDSLSISVLPPFINVTTAPFDLRLSTLATPLAQGGTRVLTPPIADDHFGNIRDTVMPDIGAYEVSVVLPVKLLSIHAKALNNDVLLHWQTASELNNAGFYIERSTDGRQFNEVDFVNGKGTINSVVHYQSTDRNAFENGSVLYYRLRQIDMDGSFSYSPVVVVNKNSSALNGLSMYPNPASHEVTVSFTGSEGVANIQVLDINGRTVLTKAVNVPEGTNTIPMPEVSGLQKGIYFVRVVSGADSHTLKLIKQ